jgi:hypothetical protein
MKSSNKEGNPLVATLLDSIEALEINGERSATNKTCGSSECFSAAVEGINLNRLGTSSLSPIVPSPRIMIYLKPWDRVVFENFFVFLKTVQDLEEEFLISIDITVGKELNE